MDIQLPEAKVVFKVGPGYPSLFSLWGWPLSAVQESLWKRQNSFQTNFRREKIGERVFKSQEFRKPGRVSKDQSKRRAGGKLGGQ